MKTLVIGYGNTLRGDDGIGPTVATQIAMWNLPQITSVSAHQLVPELAEEIAQAAMVCFVDAWAQRPDEASTAGRLECLCADTPNLIQDHCYSPGLLLSLAKCLYGVEPIAYHLLIPAIDFEYGETLSPLAIQGVYWAIKTIKTLVAQEQVCYA